MEFLAAIDWPTVGLCMVFVITLYGLFEWKNFQDAAKGLFLLAEKAMAELVIASGPEAMERVANELYDLLPPQVRLVIRAVAAFIGTTPRHLTKKLCEYIYDKVKAKYRYTQARWRLIGTNLESKGMV